MDCNNNYLKGNFPLRSKSAIHSQRVSNWFFQKFKDNPHFVFVFQSMWRSLSKPKLLWLQFYAIYEDKDNGVNMICRLLIRRQWEGRRGWWSWLTIRRSWFRHWWRKIWYVILCNDGAWSELIPQANNYLYWRIEPHPSMPITRVKLFTSKAVRPIFRIMEESGQNRVEHAVSYLPLNEVLVMLWLIKMLWEPFTTLGCAFGR